MSGAFHGGDVSEAPGFKMGEFHGASVFLFEGARQIAESVRSMIPIQIGVREFSRSNTVEDNQDDAIKGRRHDSLLRLTLNILGFVLFDHRQSQSQRWPMLRFGWLPHRSS